MRTMIPLLTCRCLLKETSFRRLNYKTRHITGLPCNSRNRRSTRRHFVFGWMWYFAYQGPSGQNVEMPAIGYPMPEQGRELVNEENPLFGPDATDPLAQAKVAFAHEAYIELISADEQGHKWLTWSFYDIGGQEFATPLL